MDLVLTDCPDLIGDVVVHDHNTSFLSDHCIISMSLTFQFPSAYSVRGEPAFNYLKADWSGLNNYLCDIDFYAYFCSSDVDYIWSNIRDVIMTGYNLFIPKLTSKQAHFPKWFTPSIRRSLNKVCSFRSLVARKHYPPHLVEKLASMEQSLQKQIRESRTEYELKHVYKLLPGQK